MRKKIAANNNQLGQTLIETLVAIFILITGLISAITLAVYSYKSIDNSSKQIIGASLASEAIEAVKNMRDTNWLNDTFVDCSADLGSGQKCYANWQGTGANKLSSGNYAVDFSSAGGSGAWVLTRTPASYVLNYDSSTGQYHTGGSGIASVYSRSVNIVEETATPYTTLNPRLKVTATVWWNSKDCAVTGDPSTLSNNCKVTLVSYLTNWKNY